MLHTHHISLALVIGGVTLALLLGSWAEYNRQKRALSWALSAQGEQLQAALNGPLDAARQHVAGMRQSAERNLRQAGFVDASLAERLERRNLAPLRDAPWDRMPQDLVKDMGSIHVNPSAGGDYRRELNAPLGALGQVVAAHNTQSRLVWSYFYDAPQRWRWVYPAQSRDEVFAATGKSDMGTALAVFWEAQGARPVEAAGPTRNPQKEPVWTLPHTDTLKGIPVVSVLAPVYAGNAYVGVMGTDLAVDALNAVMQQHPLTLGQAWVIDTEGRPLAASDSKAALPAGPYTTEAGWLRFALRGSPFSLVIYQPAEAMASQALSKTWPMLLTGLLGLLATAGTALWLSRRFTQPALQLADYVQNAEGPNIKRPPKVPALWKPWFVRAGRAAIDRRDQLMHHHQRSSQLEKRVAQVEAQARTSDSAHDNHSKI
ncbi:PDC1_MCP_like domain containing protein [Comamonadaceae bacterium]